MCVNRCVFRNLLRESSTPYSTQLAVSLLVNATSASGAHYITTPSQAIAHWLVKTLPIRSNQSSNSEDLSLNIVSILTKGRPITLKENV